MVVFLGIADGQDEKLMSEKVSLSEGGPTEEFVILDRVGIVAHLLAVVEHTSLTVYGSYLKVLLPLLAVSGLIIAMTYQSIIVSILYISLFAVMLLPLAGRLTYALLGFIKYPFDLKREYVFGYKKIEVRPITNDDRDDLTLTVPREKIHHVYIGRSGLFLSGRQKCFILHRSSLSECEISRLISYFETGGVQIAGKKQLPGEE